MKRNSVPLLVLSLILFGTFALFAGGKSEENSNAVKKTPILEVWWAASNNRPEEAPDNPYRIRTVEAIGIDYERPTVPWGGGDEFGEKLKLRLAAGDAPDIMRLPRNGFSVPEMIDGGVAADLTELLPKYAPTVYKAVPADFWKVVKYESPSKDKIFYIPTLRNASTHGAFIRKDWLDRLGLELPETKEDFYNVLKAFKEQDANGNGDPNDEIPTSGRGPGRWWDHLFTPYGVAMVEGFPTWDYYDGKLQYGGVQPEMKTALADLAEAYQDGLIDPEVLINKPATWEGKIFNDQVGIHFHMPIFLGGKLPKVYPNFEEAEWVWLPPYKVAGTDSKWSEGYVSSMNTNEKVVIANKDEETVINALKLLEYLQQPEVAIANTNGIEGRDYTMENGKMVRLPINENNPEISTWVTDPIVRTNEMFQTSARLSALSMSTPKLVERGLKTMDQMFEDAKVITVVGTSLPQNIYDGFPDIATHQLYFSTMAKILVGELSIDAFDDYVTKWYATGGEDVTARAQQAAKDLGL